jgi:hypothetical protein
VGGRAHEEGEVEGVGDARDANEDRAGGMLPGHICCQGCARLMNN